MDATAEHDRPDKTSAEQSSPEPPSPAQPAGDSSKEQAEQTPPAMDERLRQLPAYARSLLRIKLPVKVKLAATKQPVGRIIELGPGAIIQFDKSCEETLALEIGDQEVAVGEAVKVGEKFGLRITSMTMPMERFQTVSRTT